MPASHRRAIRTPHAQSVAFDPLEPRTLLAALPPAPQVFSSSTTTVLPTSALPSVTQVIVADFDGDGINDIAAADPAHGNIWFLRGEGNGQFSAPQATPVAGSIDAIAAGHFTATPRGQADLAMIGTYDDSGGGFVARVLRFKPAAGALRVVARERIADPIDRPSSAFRDSLLVGNVTGGATDEIVLQLRWGNSGTSNSNPTVLIAIYGVASGGGQASQTDQIVLKSVVKHEVLTGSARWGLYTETPQLADLDGDGVSEVIFRPGAATRAWFHPDSAGPEHRITLVANPFQNSALQTIYADVDGDSKADRVLLGLAVSTDRIGHTTIEHGLGDGSFASSSTLPSVAIPAVNSPYADWNLRAPTSVRDIDGDGQADIFFLWGGRDIRLGASGGFGYDALTTSSGGSMTPTDLTAIPFFTGYALGDLNSDGLPDLILFGNGGISTRLNVS